MAEGFIEVVVAFVVVAAMGFALPRWFEWRRGLVEQLQGGATGRRGERRFQREHGDCISKRRPWPGPGIPAENTQTVNGPQLAQ